MSDFKEGIGELFEFEKTGNIEPECGQFTKKHIPTMMMLFRQGGKTQLRTDALIKELKQMTEPEIDWPETEDTGSLINATKYKLIDIKNPINQYTPEKKEEYVY